MASDCFIGLPSYAGFGLDRVICANRGMGDMMKKLRTVQVCDEDGKEYRGAFHGWCWRDDGRGPVALIEDLESGRIFEEPRGSFWFDPPYSKNSTAV